MNLTPYHRVCVICGDIKKMNHKAKKGAKCKKCATETRFVPLNNGIPADHKCLECGKTPKEVNFYFPEILKTLPKKCNRCRNSGKARKKISEKTLNHIRSGIKEYFADKIKR